MSVTNNDIENGGGSNHSMTRSLSFYSGNEDASVKSSESGLGTTKSAFSMYSGNETSSRPSVTSKSSYVNPVVASKEQKAILFFRMAVVVVLFITLVIITTIMFSFISRVETMRFENQFNTFALETTSMVQDNFQSAIDSAEAFSIMVTSSVNNMNGTWPYVTIQDFTSKAKRLATLSGAYQIGFAPIVYPEQFAGWPVHSYLNIPSYYKEAIEVHGYDITVEEMINITESNVWHHNQLSGAPEETDPLEPKTPIQLVALRERVGFDGFFVNWQSLNPLYSLYGKTKSIINLNLLYSGFEDALLTSYEFNIPAFDSYRNPVMDPETKEFLGWESQTQMVQPIFDTIYNGNGSRKELKMVGVLNMLFDWTSLLDNLVLKQEIKDIDVVLTPGCSIQARPVTFRVDEDGVVELGLGDLHDPQYDDIGVTRKVFTLELDDETQAAMDERLAEQGEVTVEGGCVSEISISVYPTKKFEESFDIPAEWILSGAVAGAFLFTSLVFFAYDFMVRRRQNIVMERIIRQDKIVLNTFPKVIRDKLYKDSEHNQLNDSARFSTTEDSTNTGNSMFGSAQLAELYPSATVVFADIVGFTAWSSAREPNQVFKLLETIYKEFDKIAYRNNIFKVETVGDCYVAVAGVPEKCDNHALHVANFSRDCMHKMPSLVGKLEILLGPDTADLQLRIGVNTGQVTAGVLRGDKARFQLFGDTVNTASRMETTSNAGRIHISAATADALVKAGKERWLKPRGDTVLVKGKGQMQTFYLETREDSMQRVKLAKYRKNRATDVTTMAGSVITEEESNSSEDNSSEDEEIIARRMSLEEDEDIDMHQVMSKSDRLVEWNVEILSYLLKQILVARPENLRDIGTSVLAGFEDTNKGDQECAPTTVLDEFQEIIELPSINMEELLQRKSPSTIELKPAVVEQLRDLIKNIATMYNENPFHNFEHASHVTASVRKLLTRIVDADYQRNNSSYEDDIDRSFNSKQELVDLSGHSYGITSDPLTQFAVIFSAVIHDADHPGVPNAQLVKEDTRLAQMYRKSIAEQNSVELVWDLLMSSDYTDLRSCIYSNEEELKRFRQLVVNTVMATDIVDKELQNLRKMRWEKAFSSSTDELSVDSFSTPHLSTLNMNRKATIVIEHLIQASDVSHTMQHWNIYKKWNERFFFELYDAYRNGRAETDPSINWYKGEIGFFDFYIIPLAKKLESCGVFGVSSHEYLNYAQSNREEWVREGEEVVKEFLQNYHRSRESSTRTMGLRSVV